ncbi:MAG: alpha/beta fold hydrolase [Nitrospinae bacterium]|nr:alpha/beta fold hydrolase [Nitrospinota bacterium]
MNGLMGSFEPHPLVRGGIMQTVFAAKMTESPALPPRVRHRVELGKNSTLLLFELERQNPGRPQVLLAHGMGGCSESPYMLRMAGKLWTEGFGVFMMNHRGSGPGIGLCDRLWNGGSSGDLDSVVRFILRLHPRDPVLIVGFSLSGNILLKYLGEGRLIPSNVAGAFAVNPPVDLKVASQMLSEGRFAAIFNGYYMKMIRRQAQALVECFPGVFHPPVDSRTIREFDEKYTAPAAGFKDVEEYYSQCSANRFIESIRVPSVILSARDDPFVPPDDFQRVPMSPSVRYYAPDEGGHLGYISKDVTPLGDHRWMDHVIVEWAKACG